MKPDSAKWLEKASHSIRASEGILQVDIDSAAGRVYYAMFYCAEALLLSIGLTFSSNAAVISAFGLHFAKTKILPTEMHRWLLDGFEKRQLGDYEFVTGISDGNVSDLKSKTEQFISLTEAYLSQEGHL